MRKAIQLLFVLTLIVSCSDTPTKLTDQQMQEVTKDKKLCYVSISSSGDLKPDFPNNIGFMYAENGEGYTQRLSVEDKEIPQPEKEKFPMLEKYAPKNYDELLDFDFSKALENAGKIINKESDNSLNYTLVGLNVYSYKNKFYRTLTYHATKKDDKATYKFSHRKITTVRDYYELTFEALKNGDVKLIEN